MKRVLFLAGLLFLSVTVWSSTASAWVLMDSKADAWNAAQASAASNPDYGCCNDLYYSSDFQMVYKYFISTGGNTGGWAYYRDTGGCADYFYQNVSGTWVCSSDPPPPPPPLCEDPSYIDVVTGECVEKVTKCITDLETMSLECVLLREDDPEGQNCVTDASGLQLCLNDNPLCYTVNGKTFCPEADSVCGYKNGSFSCIAPAEEGCGTFNGEKVCLTPDGTKVDPLSPDHPDNGGNLDGDPTNDVTDSRDPVDGGDPTNQPGVPVPTTDADRASEKTAKDQLNQLRDVNKNLGKNTEAITQGIASLSNEISDGEANSIVQNGVTGSWDDPATGTWSEVDSHIAGIGTNGLDDGLADGVGDSVLGLVDQGSCVDLGFTFKGHTLGLPCDKTKKIRDMLSWVFYFLTVWTLFGVVTEPHVRRS